jgi:hypothetical protein
VGGGNVVYVPWETILKEKAAKIKLSMHFFLVLVRELSDKPRISSIAYPVDGSIMEVHYTIHPYLKTSISYIFICGGEKKGPSVP